MGTSATGCVHAIPLFAYILQLYFPTSRLTELPLVTAIHTSHECLTRNQHTIPRPPSIVRNGDISQMWTHSHWLIRRPSLHLIISTFPLLTPRTFESVRFGIRLADSFGFEEIVFGDFLIHRLDTL